MPKNIRDFIYMDIERIRSFTAQLSEGLTSERVSGQEQSGEAAGSFGGGIPLIANAQGNLDYRFAKTASETKSLHDYIFEEFLKGLQHENLLEEIDAKKFDWKEAAFTDGIFVSVSGAVKIIDYKATIESLTAMPNMAALIDRITSKPEQKSTKAQPQVNPLSKQIKNQPVKEAADLVDQFLGELVRIKVFPFDKDRKRVFVGSAERAFFRYSPSALTGLYGAVIDAHWTALLQVNKGQSDVSSYLVQQTEAASVQSIEDAVENLADILVNLTSLTQGIKFPAVAVTPIAIYRNI